MGYFSQNQVFRQADAKDGQKSGNGTEVGFFIPVPDFLASQFPSLVQDLSPRHITFLHVGVVPENRRELFLEIVQRVFEELDSPVRGHLGALEYFVHPDKNQRAAVCLVRFSHDLAGLRWKLRDRLQDAGFDVDDKFPLIYRPHTTLEYIEGFTAPYVGEMPQGSWNFDGMEIWGLPDVVKVRFGAASVKKVAQRHLKAMEYRDMARRVTFRWIRGVCL